MGMPLAAIADHGDAFIADELNVGIFVVINLHANAPSTRSKRKPM
jgi:hypothetical protein